MGARDAHHVEIVAETARIAPGSSICRVHQCVRSCRAHGLWVWRVAVGVGVLAPLSVTRQAANAEGALYSMIVSKTFISSF